MSHLRPDVSSQKSRFTKMQRILIITLSSAFVLSGLALSTSAALRAKLGFAKASKPEIVQQPQARKSMGTGLLRFAGIEKTERAFSLTAPLAPTVTATKTDSLFADADGDNQADPGDTIKYTVNISASGQDATGVTFTDTVDPNTTFVPGSLTATPVAVDDSYSALGNVRISVAAPGVLGNDFAGLPSATITAPPVTSANGGDVTLNADGSFTYNPPAGFEGTDTFTYTLTNAQGSNNATVTINVSGMIWFIDNNASCPCDGRLTNPFNTLASFQAVNNGAGNNPAANDNIFIYESGSAYAGSVTLLNGQRFIGQDATASLSSITGLTPPPGSDPLPITNSANGTIVNIQSAGISITVAAGNTLTGFTGGSSATDISGSGFGTLTISDVTLNGVGQALDLTNGTLAATFGSISSTNSTTTGISLTSVGGSLTSPTTTITNPTGSALTVNTSSGSLNFGNTNASNSGSTGVSLTTNTGTITFGSLSISPAANQRGLLATDNTNTITSTSGAVITTGATAVEITRAAGTTPLAITLTSVSATASAPNGIYLKNTSGSFTVNGDGTNTSVGGNGSGGNIANTVGADGAIAGNGVYLDNAGNVALRRITINGTNQNHGIRGVNGNSGFTLEYSTVSGTNGTNAALNEGSVKFDNLTGSAAITSSLIEGGFTGNLNVLNTSGVLDRLIITGSTFGFNNTTTGNNSVQLQSQGVSTVLNATINSSTFKGARADWINASSITNSTMEMVIGSGGANTFDNTGANAHAGSVPGGNRIVLSSNATLAYKIQNNILKGSRGSAIFVRSTGVNGLGGAEGNMNGRVTGNTIGVQATANSGSSESSGIDVEADGGGDHISFIDSNQIFQYNNHGIFMNFGDNTAGTAGSSARTMVIQMTVTNNTISNPGNINTNFNGIHLNSGTTAEGAGTADDDQFTVCADIKNNHVVGGGQGAVSPNNQDIRLRQRILTTVKLPGYAGANNDNTAVQNFEAAQNNVGGTPTVAAANTVSTGGGGYIGGSACTAPSITMASFSAAQKSASNVQSDSSQAGDANNGTDILRVDRGQSTDLNTGQSLTQAAVDGAVQAALERWHNAGISDDDMMRLRSVTFEVSHLPDGQLASASSTNVTLDETAAGYGWYVDPTPMEDSEFNVAVPQRELQANEYSAAFGHIDLLTVIMRELGVVYGQGNTSIPDRMQTLMQGTLSPSIRRLPDSQGIELPKATAKAAVKNPQGTVASETNKQFRLQPATLKTADRQTTRLMNHAVRARTATAAMTFADVMLTIGTLPAGESVTITFNATVNNPFTGASPQVSNQGTVSGSNFGSVLTDDPDVPGTADPTVTPIDLPSVSVAVSPASVLEDGATNLVYTFTRTGSTANAMTVNFNVGGTASFTEPDYTQTGAATFTATGGTVVIPAGSSTAAVTIDPSADTTVEPDETVNLTVTSGTGYTVGSPGNASGTITNDDTDVTVAVSPASVAEDGATNLTYTFTRAGVTTNSLTVNFSVGGTATFGASPNDYTETGATTFMSTSGSVTFAAGSSTAVVTVDPEADNVVEPDETVVLTLTTGTGYNVASPGSATGTITNDDANVSVAVSPSSVTEDGAANLVYTFTRNGFTGGALTVNFTVGGTADFGASPNDYTETGATTFTSTTGSVTFGAGSSTAVVTVDPEADTTPEPDETVIITLAAGAGYTVVSPSSATGTILNDDTIVTVAVSPATTAEGGANMVYTFTRTGSTAGAVTVNFSVGGSASFPADYSQSGAATFAPPNASVTIGAGSSTATLTVTPLSDCEVEGNETVEFTVQPGTGYGVGSPSIATGTITNTPDSGAPTITLIPNVNMTLWPPNHQYVSVAVTDFVASASDNCDPTVNLNSVYILKITSDEAENGDGDGDTLNDIVIGANCKTAQLRAERAVSGDGRVYTITFKVKDSAGNFATATAQVTVRKSANTPAVDSGTVYTVNSSCP